MSKNTKLLSKYIIFIFIFATSCIIVREKKVDEEFDIDYSILPKPKIELSDQPIFSPNNDFIAFLPKGWSLVDPEEKNPTNVFAIAVDQNYAFSAIFSKLSISGDVRNILKNEGLLYFAKASYEFRNKKSLGNIQLVGNFTPLKNGRQKFYIYDFNNVSKGRMGKCAIFITSLNNCYEFTLIPIELKAEDKTTRENLEDVFYSILSSIQF